MRSQGDSAVADIGESADEAESAAEPSELDAAGDEAAESTEDRDEKPSKTSRLKRVAKATLRWVATGVVVVVLAGAGYEGWLLYQQHEKNVAAAQALDAARKYAVTLTTTDPNAIDQNFTDILGGATGDFKDTYTKASSRLRKMLIDNKVATQGTVLDSAVKSATANQVVVLLFVKQMVTNSASPDPRIDLTDITITMEKVNGRWLASKVVLPAEQG